MTRKFQLLTPSALCLLVLLTSLISQAQTTISQAQTTASTTVPRLVRYGGIVRDLNGKSLTGVVGVTFALYAGQTGGAALWLETQNVQPDANGHYSVLLGSTKPDGLPAELFASEQARWIGVQVEQQTEQPRRLLVSAPYALKAGDAETLGGLPPSAFMQVTPSANGSASQSSPLSAATTATAAGGVLSNASSDVTTTGGTANKIAMFTKATNIQNSMITQSGSKVGIGTAAPAYTLQVEGSSTTATGIQSVTTNTSKATNSFAAVSATSSAGVTTEMVTDGLGTGPLKTASGYVGTYTDEPMGFVTNNLERMRITKGGFVGLGTSSPTAWLQVDSQNLGMDGILANGFTAAAGSNQNGSNGITVNGGAGDLTNDDTGQAVGGDGVVATAGDGDGFGGNGVVGTGGTGSALDGVGGVFTGGNNVGDGDGIDAFAGSGYAGYFDGNVLVFGTLSASTKDFKIDHPLDPANQYLVHASVESSEMMNIYTGNVTTDASGAATVQLPSWFEVLNTDFRYQLTVIGQFAQAIVAGKVHNHQFTIKTNAPNVEVSWQITGVRQDAYAKAHPLVVEEQKEARLKGYYMHPELYGAPAQKQIDWARHPQMMRKMQQHRQQMGQKQTRLAASAKP